MAKRKINDSAKVRLVIDGVVLSTTAGNLRRGSISTCLLEAWQAFEAKYLEHGWTGLLADYHDGFMNRTHQIQIDLY